MLSHRDVDLDSGLKFESQMIVISRHPFEQFPNRGIVIFFNLRMLGFKKSLDPTPVAPDSCAARVF